MESSNDTIGESEQRFTGTRFVVGNIGPDDGTGISGDSGRDSPGSATDTTGESNNSGPRKNRRAPVWSGIGKRRRSANDEKINKASAEMVVGVVETFSVMRFGKNASKDADGNDGRLTGTERRMMTEGIAGSLASLPIEVSQQVSDMSAPVMAVLGMMLYLVRASSLEQRRRANLAEQQRSHAADAVFSAEQIISQNGEAVFDPNHMQAPTKADLNERFGA